MAVCDVKDLAKYVIGKCTLDGMPVSNLQLQKILYFLQVVYCRATSGELLFDEEFEAWPYGPVIPEIYDEYARYGSDPIEESHEEVRNLFTDEDTRCFVDAGIEFLREKYPWDLVRTSHAKGSPWELTWDGGDGYKSTIDNGLIIQSALAGAPEE